VHIKLINNTSTTVLGVDRQYAVTRTPDLVADLKALLGADAVLTG
jgi:hypothetical protein